ncbi:putative membrane protein YphA (DoxX/SURF4 family) [Streptomyces sp. SAI-144]|nr:putative membrane protein YphA (DoxX/SURF4 family) [Streptomyces sp. SAI-144]MDH6493115.1 putative membrane protein YphA (DoxX/SURF4 family) [Streptomyces sp. SAI-127]
METGTIHDLLADGALPARRFMLGLLGIGVALIAGVALRFAVLGRAVMMALMWVAEWPLAQHLSDGSASMSTNPFADYHLIYAVVLIALAAASAAPHPHRPGPVGPRQGPVAPAGDRG